MTSLDGHARDLSALRVLVVDDNRFMLSVIEAMLSGLGVTNIRVATSVDGAMDAFDGFPADVVITDWKMGPPDGIELIRRLRRSKDSPDPCVPIIMLTGYGEKRRVIEARDAGVSQFLAKPVSALALYQRITWILDNPAPFVDCEGYFGPDRRHRDAGPPTGMTERRRGPRDVGKQESEAGPRKDDVAEQLKFK